MPRKTTKAPAREPTRLDEKALLSRITIEPGKCSGRPCIRGMRIRVIDILELVAYGMTPKQIVKQYPYVEEQDVKACLLYAARYIDHPRLVA
jgi:uncharacterized protein (DUF433 family)